MAIGPQVVSYRSPALRSSRRSISSLRSRMIHGAGIIAGRRCVDLEPHPGKGFGERTAARACRRRALGPAIGVESEFVSRREFGRDLGSPEHHPRGVGRLASPLHRPAVERRRLQDRPRGDDDQIDAFPGRQIDRAAEGTTPRVRRGFRGLPRPLERDPMTRVLIGCDQEIVRGGGPVYCGGRCLGRSEAVRTS